MLKTQTRRAIDPRHAKTFDTSELRAEFLIEDLFRLGEVNLTYSHYDRMIVGGAMPENGPLIIDEIKETGTPSWLDRREAVLACIAGKGSVEADGQRFEMGKCDMLYLGMGCGPVSVTGEGSRFYIISAPAHREIPARLVAMSDAALVSLGERGTSNERVIYQFVHPTVMQSCQIVMGMTELREGSVWNTMPAHRHDRRSEVYLYLDLPKDQVVIHLMGEPEETRHIIVGNEQAVLSPPWSIHSGAGTSSYSFIWAMAGDNVDYTDVDIVEVEGLR